MNCVIRLSILVSFITISGQCFAQQSVFDTITSRIVKDMQSEVNDVARLDQTVSKNSAALQDDGFWKDINYKDTVMAGWSAAGHLARVQDFALAYGNSNSKYRQSKALYSSIVKALRAWNKADPRCRNWWYNEINCPQMLGQIMILMNHSKPLATSLQDSLIQKMKRGDMYKQTGANKLDVALHNLYRGLLTRDKSLMDAAIGECFQPVVLTTAPEGLQYDYSYLQHGPQLQIASYGVTFLVGEYKVASYVRNTPWQLSEEKRHVLATFCNQVFLKTIRGKYFDFNVMGRRYTRKELGNLNTIVDMHSNINLLQNSGYVNAQDFDTYNDVLKRISGNQPPSYHIKPIHTQFWKGDYTLDARPGYLFTVRTNSVRTRRTETGNGENLYGRYMGDGATNIQRSGSEYFNIFPVWEFDKIPGVTCRDYKTDRPAVNSWEQPGTTNFTGGVSDGLYGASTYSLAYDSVKAKKAWFFFDKEIVCLGAGIQSNTPENITTSVNQCWSKGAVIISNIKKSYWHDSIGYYFRPDAHISLSNTEQKGTWYHINTSQSKDTVRGKVFKLWLNHGIHPQNASYSYIVVPGISTKQFSQGSPFSKLNILCNTNAMQAVSCPELNILQVVFYRAGTLHDGKTMISVNEPCVLMLKKTNTGNSEILIADPTQKLKTIIVTINGKKANCVLPVNEYAGSTFKYVLK
jgi:chondroitin AC lyase